MSEVAQVASETKESQLVPAQNALTEFEKVGAGLLDLSTKYANVVYDVATTKGMDEAKAARLAIREPRYAVQRATDAAKKELNSIKKNVEERGEQIVAALLKIETPIDAQIKAHEELKAAEKARKEREESERVARIQAAIASIRAIPGNVVAQSAAEIKAALDGVASLQITESEHQEFFAHAADAKDTAVSQLITMHQRAVAAEEAQAAIKAQQEDLANIRAQAEAEIAAERAKAEADLAAQRAEIARQQKELDDARTAAEAARLAERQLIDAAAARAAAAEAEREAEESRQAAALQEDAFADELAEAELAVRGAEQSSNDAKVDVADTFVAGMREIEGCITKPFIDAASKILTDIGFDGEEIPAAPKRAPHVDQPLPIDLIELPVVSGRPADMDIVVAVADAFDVSIEVALDYITSINVQAVVEAIAEAA